MRFYFGFTLMICVISPRLFGLESSFFGDKDWNFFDANSATIPAEAVSSDLGWTPTNDPDDIFGLNSDSLHPLDDNDLVFDGSAIANACVNPGFHRPRRQRRGQTQMQCGTEPPNESKTSPAVTEITPSISSLYNHELCPDHEYHVFAVCDSGTRLGRYSQGDGFFALFSCTILDLAKGCWDPHRVWCCIVLETVGGIPIADFYQGHILDALQGLYDASYCQLQNPARPVEFMPFEESSF